MINECIICKKDCGKTFCSADCAQIFLDKEKKKKNAVVLINSNKNVGIDILPESNVTNNLKDQESENFENESEINPQMENDHVIPLKNRRRPTADRYGMTSIIFSLFKEDTSMSISQIQEQIFMLIGKRYRKVTLINYIDEIIITIGKNSPITRFVMDDGNIVYRANKNSPYISMLNGYWR